MSLATPSPPAPQPFRVTQNCWMIGHRNPSSLLQCNTYLRIFDEAPRPYNLCVDPGSQIDYPMIEANLQHLIGSVQAVDAMSVNHQDPDVIGNAATLCNENPRVHLLVSQDTWRLAQHLTLRPGRLQFSGERDSPMMSVGDRRRWQAVPTPFCHFRGAVAFFDPEIRTLFTGDLLGGLNQLGRVHLFAEEDDWAGVAQFHQIYMPSREVLRYAVRQIRALSPAVEVIAPQHGHIIVGDRIPDFLDRLESLLVGHDLLACEHDDGFAERYADAMRQAIAWSQEIMGREEVAARLAAAEAAHQLAPNLRRTGETIEVVRGGYAALAHVFNALTTGESVAFVNQLRSLVMVLCAAKNLPVPGIGLGEQVL